MHESYMGRKARCTMKFNIKMKQRMSLDFAKATNASPGLIASPRREHGQAYFCYRTIKDSFIKPVWCSRNSTVHGTIQCGSAPKTPFPLLRVNVHSQCPPGIDGRLEATDKLFAGSEPKRSSGSVLVTHFPHP